MTDLEKWAVAVRTEAKDRLEQARAAVADGNRPASLEEAQLLVYALALLAEKLAEAHRAELHAVMERVKRLEEEARVLNASAPEPGEAPEPTLPLCRCGHELADHVSGGECRSCRRIAEGPPPTRLLVCQGFQSGSAFPWGLR